jgi:2-polyprenyl-6-methoxyphenol hydroxylase-like FAD-dependent oxidoreductase
LEEIHLHDAVGGKELLSFGFASLHSISPTPGVCIAPQNETERLLYEAGVASGLIEVRFGQAVAAFDADDSGVRTRVQDGDKQYVLESEYLCGCDGAHSAVRQGLGFELEGKTYVAHAVLADVLIEDERDELPWPRANLHVRNLSAVIRFAPGYWRIIFAEGGGTDEGPPDPAFVQAKVNELIGPGFAEIVWSSSFKIHCRNAPHFRVGRVLLLGDAAHLNSPAGGQGMNAGIQDAHNVAWKLALCTKGADPEPLLKSYDEERYDAIVHGVDVATDRLTRIGILGPPWIRSVGLGLVKFLMRYTSIQRRMARGAGMLNLRYDQSTLIDATGGRYVPDIELGDGLRLRKALGPDGGLIELAQDGTKLFLGEATYDLSTQASKEIQKAGGPYLTIRPDHVIAYAGASKERAEHFQMASGAPSLKVVRL